MTDARHYTNCLRSLIDQEIVDYEEVCAKFMHWLSEQDIKDFVQGQDSGYLEDLMISYGICEPDED